MNQRQLSEETTEVRSAQAQQHQLQQQRRRKHKYEYIDDDERSVRSDSPLNPALSQVIAELLRNSRTWLFFLLTVILQNFLLITKKILLH